MIAQELEVTLHRAFVEARDQRHEFITVEHLLLALLDNPSAAGLLRACGDVDRLRSDLARHVAEHTPRVPEDRDVDTQPTLGFQRVIQRAILHVQSSGEKEVTGANVLVALFGEEGSHAVYFLKQQNIARFDVTAKIARGAFGSDPSRVQVVIRDDEGTPMEFLASVLQEFFEMSRKDAAETMLEVYRDGAAVCGLYPREAAEALVKRVLERARERGYALRCDLVTPRAPGRAGHPPPRK